MYNERKALEKYSDYLEKQIDRLYDEYHNTINRVRELDEIERAASKPEPPTMTLKEAVEAHNEAHPPKEGFTYNREKERAKDAGRKRKDGRQDMTLVTSRIISILKEAGRPLRTKEVAERYEDEFGVPLKNYGVSISQAHERSARIERVMRGYYQYNLL